MGATEAVIRKGRKFDQVLEGAREVFLSEGFEGASVDDIARVAGVSKATLYSYFPDKRLLFLEVAKGECLRQADEAMELVQLNCAPRKLLGIAARKMLEFMNTDLSMNVFRICVAESERFPELAQEFYRSGPMLARGRLCDYLTVAVARGELVIKDVELAADQFAELCKSRIFVERIFGIRSSYTREEVEYFADEAVETFLARYGKEG
ncbi:TetR family transcriptional regulator [Pseudooceanicola sp. 216_PA32_1]|uniref:TetR family transcriptional regulator n=1 Tax=Pseudooceanicola pacificus TaxID=2676438 RepID=A0A844WCW2_9RHOB|nr:TetR/AcrR family transcriptional regulator [Pseudooceanicola pacificus]MWB76559.1 TetR family transcriptional regulator [Pseudooceanicola pacificus]